MARQVAVVGPADGDDRVIETAYSVGRLLAAAGAIVLTGGLTGVMSAALEGARDAGGLGVGLLPGTSRDDGSPAAGVLVATGLGELRNALLVRSADAVISVGGSWGTLSEIALARRSEVPVVCVAGWSVRDETGAELPLMRAASAEQAVQLALR